MSMITCCEPLYSIVINTSILLDNVLDEVIVTILLQRPCPEAPPGEDGLQGRYGLPGLKVCTIAL